jgi:UDP-2,4-diacetamido-2,4,6-trideoxy-beta-L-altropyranose hydrolase
VNVLIRTDSSVEIGTGHAVRCLTLAGILRHNRVTVSFICRDLPGHISDLIEAHGYVVHRLNRLSGGVSLNDIENLSSPYQTWLGVHWQVDAEQTRAVLACQHEPVNWLIVDHYALDVAWERSMRADVNYIMAIDDIANRRHDCDVLLDQNLWPDCELRYERLVPAHCRKFIGPRYALLRAEFHDARRRLRSRDGRIRRIMVFFGGVDASNQTAKALEAIVELARHEIAVDVIVGQNNPHRKAIVDFCESQPGFFSHCQVSNMAELMNRADLAIGAAGTATWERCFVGLPCITVAIASNQRKVLENVAAEGCVVDLGWGETVSVNEFRDAVATLIKDPGAVRAMSKRCLEMMAAAENNHELVHHLLAD